MLELHKRISNFGGDHPSYSSGALGPGLVIDNFSESFFCENGFPTGRVKIDPA